MTKNKEKWLQRKLDHINNFLESSDGPGTNGLEDIHIPHQALPGLSWDDVTIECSLFKKKLSMPLIINAITGGPPEALEINKVLAKVAKKANIGMAVGSQSIAIKNPCFEKSFRVVRDINPEGLLIANVAANVSPEMVIKAIEMLQADAIQLHLNPAQELYMEEGDRDFSEIENNIKRILDICPVDVIIKEVGFGISKETALKLVNLGVKWVDIGGSGGTNFIKIESKRWDNKFIMPSYEWGIPTAASLMEVKDLKNLNIIASGGIKTSLDAVKCFALGAKAVAIAGPLLKLVVNEGESALIEFITNYGQDLKRLLLLSGAATPLDMRNVDIVITGKIKDWSNQRGLKPR